ncbi:beta transducin-like protein [Fusarium fujikuroi]|nr:beta transducin-like protein [Fusarium fujikuroi]
MRLIKARTLVETQRISFVEFYGDRPRYAILSHTWETHQEITYQDCNRESSKAKTGYDKIRKTCELALGDGLDYVWIDTCCIDKSSSAELTEAINSMFLWYQEAAVCYVYLVDKFEGSSLGDCRWFSRGWTLQELIAPKFMSFFNNSWDCIGSKNSLMGQLAVITPIDPDILRHNAPISSACIAKRLSWAAGRKTTRVEDMAYCLLGICNIHMPLLYGEGKIAFRRLQEEIIRSTYDLSLLAWTPPVSSDVVEEEYCGFLADSVNHFASCSEMYSVTDSLMDEGEISVSNKGLRLMARVCVLDYSDQGYRYVLKLDCMAPGFEGDFLTIPMRKVGPNTFVRAHSLCESDYSFHLETASWGESAFYTVTLLTTMPSLAVRSPFSVARGPDLISSSRLTLVSIELPSDISIVYAVETPVKFWNAEDRAFFGPHGSYQNWGAFVLETNTLFICFWHKVDGEWVLEASL